MKREEEEDGNEEEEEEEEEEDQGKIALAEQYRQSIVRSTNSIPSKFTAINLNIINNT